MASPSAAPTAMAMPMETAKPQCGGGGTGDAEYDLPLHVIGLFLVLASSCFGAGFPVVAKKIKSLKIPPKVFFFCKHFGTGVLIATAFVHLLPTAFQSLNDPCLPDLFTVNYPPLPGVIAMGALFCLFSIELYMNYKMGDAAHDHGGATGENILNRSAHVPHGAHAHGHGNRGPMRPQPHAQPEFDPNGYPMDLKRPYTTESQDLDSFKDQLNLTDNSIPSEMPPWFVAFYEQYVRQRDEMLSMMQKAWNVLPEYPAKNEPQISAFEVDDEEKGGELTYETCDPLVYQKMSMDITLLEGGILFHSVFVGMTVSITTDGFVILLIAILFHQTFEGLGLGSRIAAVPYPKGSIKPWLLVFAFGTTAPIGQAIGLITRGSYDPNSAFALILVGTFNSISSGLLIYAALVDLLKEDFLSEEANRTLSMKQKIIGFSYLLMGAAGMATVGAFA